MFKFWPIHRREHVVFSEGKARFDYELRCWPGTWTVYRLESIVQWKTWQRTVYSRESMVASIGNRRLWLRASTGEWYEWDDGDRVLAQQHFTSRKDAYECVRADALERIEEIAWENLGGTE